MVYLKYRNKLTINDMIILITNHCKIFFYIQKGTDSANKEPQTPIPEDGAEVRDTATHLHTLAYASLGDMQSDRSVK